MATDLFNPISGITPSQLNGGQTGSAPAYAVRAWVNFNGTGTVAIRASGNVSSITDNGVGDYTINFTTAMPDANYAWAAACTQDTATNVFAHGFSTASQLTGSLRINTTQAGLGVVDPNTCTVVVLR